MSLTASEAQQFVVVGARLGDELKQNDVFNGYFEPRQEAFKFYSTVDELVEQFQQFQQHDILAKTLFIVKHFDQDPDHSGEVLEDDHLSDNFCTPNAKGRNPMNACDDSDLMETPQFKTPKSCIRHSANNNNNHLTNPQLARVAEEEVSELESVGYTTDYDDADEQIMETSDDHLTDSGGHSSSGDYDGGRCFTMLASRKCSIMGAMAFLQTIKQLKSSEEPIKMIPRERPLHNLAMTSAFITFSGISSKREAQRLLTLTRYMGAKSREDVTNKTTHLVAGNPRGMKYRRALELGLYIMSPAWVRESYRLAQHDVGFEAHLPEIVQIYKLKPFHGLQMAFVGFKEDLHELRELTVANEGTVVEATSASCSHIVVDAISGSTQDCSTTPQVLVNLNPTNANVHVVYSEWFWASLEMEGKASEDAYAVPGFKTQTRRSSRAYRASVGHNSLSNVLSPLLDYSRSPESLSCTLENRRVSRAQSVIATEELDLSKITARHRACLELLQTERNYVRILETIVNLFKLPLENPGETSDPILPATDVKIIFGNLTPIYKVHKRMLGNLEGLIESDWNETNCIGKVFVSHSIEMLKAYPPFVNFFENTKKTITQCDAKYPRFHAFLKRCQSRIECNRESLTEMLIRPVQRLPSISLIITELIKRTDEANPDKKYLDEALESIRRVMNLINEDKRKTEGQIAMFDIVNNIEDCPPSLLSATRRFVCKVEARLLFMTSESEITPSRSQKVVLFIFSDLIEICKIRSLKRSHSTRSGSRNIVPTRGINAMHQASGSKFSHKKDYRHMDDLRLSDVMNLYKDCSAPELEDAFVLVARPSPKYDKNFRFYPILLDDETMTKEALLQRLEECLCTVEETEYTGNETEPISNDKIDFSYSGILVNSLERTRLSRVLSIRQVLMSPSMKAPYKGRSFIAGAATAGLD